MSPIQQMLLGVGAVATKTYVDDVFNTFLYKGNNSTNTLNTGLDMSGKGGLVWLKARSSARQHILFDTARGANKKLASNENYAEFDGTGAYNQTFTSTGFTVNNSLTDVNDSNVTYSSSNFRKAPGFFDIVTYTGNNTARTISHSLGSVPGLIMVKATNRTSDWVCWHRELGNTDGLVLNSNAAKSTPPWNATYWNSTGPTATHFSIGTNADVNHGDSGDEGTYVAYVFAGGESDAATARSISLDGSNDGLKTSTSSDYAFGTGDFTVEFWIKVDELGNTMQTVDHRDPSGSTTGHWVNYISTSGDYKFWMDGDRITGQEIAAGTWNHIANVRQSGVTKLYINGTSQGEWTDTTNYTNQRIIFGLHGPNETSFPVDGNFSNIRIVTGTAVYTESFNPPTGPLENITNTKFLAANNASVTGTTVGTAVAVDSPTASTDSPFDDPAGFVFGESGSENVIKCGSYVGSGSAGLEVNLGFEPQWVMWKRTDSTSSWFMVDSMRGIVTGGNDPYLLANNSNSENSSYSPIEVTSTGFKLTSTGNYVNGSGNEYIFVAVRSPDGYVGKPIENATKCFAMDTGAGNSTIPNFDSGFPVDMAIWKKPDDGTHAWGITTRFTWNKYLPITTAAEISGSTLEFDSNVGWQDGSWADSNYQSWMFKRGQSFDVVTYEGNAVAGRTIPHSLNKTIEMMWVKRRNSARSWNVYHKGLNGGSSPEDYILKLDTADAEANDDVWNDQAPTSTHFVVGNSQSTNGNGDDYIAMLFASVDGISKCGFYTGNGAWGTNNITTGFTPRFVIIKQTDSAKDWVVLDTTRGWGSGSDEYLLLNKDDAEASWDHGAPTSTGFTLGSDDMVNGDTNKYIYYAHA